MTRKSFLNNTKEGVHELIEGIVEVYPGLSAYPEKGITFLNKYRGNKVAILSGGGSGHEPFPIGFIADNMLTGSVSGPIFTSPSTPNILTAINILSNLNKGGVLVAVLNYTGDQLNFGLAMERAKNKGIEVEKISISDDVALLGTDNGAISGNRGICGCTFIFKLLGAMADEERSLQELIANYRDISKRVASMGVCMVPCRLPNSKDLLFELKEDEVSLGCGIHGEAGISTIKLKSLEDLVAQVLDKIFESGAASSGDKVCVLIGNLGSMAYVESFIVAKEVQKQLDKKKMKIVRMYVGSVMPSLDMKGFQISILNVNHKDNWARYLDSPTSAYGWPGTPLSYSTQKPVLQSIPHIDTSSEQMEGPKLNEKDSNTFRSAVMAACQAVKENVAKINELDSGCGDGDCGTTLLYFAQGILAQADTLPWNWVGSCLVQLSRIAETDMGGTTGAVYSLLLAGAARGISRSWEESWASALQTLYSHSPARVGHRTLVDALAPACDAYCACIAKGNTSWKRCLKEAVMAARTGCHNTTTMNAKVGRASYAASSMLKNFDAGAFAVTMEGPKLNEKDSNTFRSAVMAACQAVKENVAKINELDSGCGDGDFILF